MNPKRYTFICLLLLVATAFNSDAAYLSARQAQQPAPPQETRPRKVTEEQDEKPIKLSANLVTVIAAVSDPVKEAIEMAQRYDVTIFGISTKNFSGGVSAGTSESSDDKDLRRLCEETGGQLFLPSQKVELFRAFSQVAEDLRQEYVIFYTPQNQQKAGKRRSIKVKLIGADGRLYHKQGYTY